jgi:hypothetical protein
MSEALYIPEENLEEVIQIIRTGMKHSNHVSRNVKRNLDLWCHETEQYLRELQDDAEEEVKPRKKKK